MQQAFIRFLIRAVLKVMTRVQILNTAEDSQMLHQSEKNQLQMTRRSSKLIIAQTSAHYLYQYRFCWHLIICFVGDKKMIFFFLLKIIFCSLRPVLISVRGRSLSYKLSINKQTKVYSPCPCDCELDENPVCGRDGKTYFNKCLADCHKVVSYQ